MIFLASNKKLSNIVYIDSIIKQPTKEIPLWYQVARPGEGGDVYVRNPETYP